MAAVAADPVFAEGAELVAATAPILDAAAAAAVSPLCLDLLLGGLGNNQRTPLDLGRLDHERRPRDAAPGR